MALMSYTTKPAVKNWQTDSQFLESETMFVPLLHLELYIHLWDICVHSHIWEWTSIRLVTLGPTNNNNIYIAWNLLCIEYLTSYLNPFSTNLWVLLLYPLFRFCNILNPKYYQTYIWFCFREFIMHLQKINYTWIDFLQKLYWCTINITNNSLI